MDEETNVESWSTNNYDQSLNNPDKTPGDSKNWKWSKLRGEWRFVDDESLDPQVERVFEEVEDIYSGVIEKMAEDRVYAPSLDEAKVILSHIALESATESSDNFARNACKPTIDFIDSQINLTDLRGKMPKDLDLYFEKVATDPDEYRNSNASNCRVELERVKFFERLSLETSDELALFIAQNLDKYEPSVIQESSESGSFSFVYSLLHEIHMSEEAQNEVARLSLEYASRVSEDLEKNEPWGSYEYYLDEFTHWGRRRLFSPIELDVESPEFKSEMNLYINENGLTRVLNMLRADLTGSEKAEKAQKMILFMLGNVAHRDDETHLAADRNVDEFYNAIFIEPKEYLLNTSEAKEFRINMVAHTLRSYGVPNGAEISEFACGNGWLSGGLESQGFRVHAFDRHPTMVELGNKDYPNVVFMRFDWNRWQDWKELKKHMVLENSQDAVIVNGRSDRHMQYPYETMGEIASILKDNGVYMSDSPDVETEGTSQEQQLSKNRDFHEMFGFYRPWLEKYFWHTVGAPKGQDGVAHLIESWVPSKELKILYAEANALKHMETIVEPNYDGHGSNNNYFIFKRVPREEEHEFKSNALEKIDEYFSNQPKDPAKWGEGDVATYRD